MPQSVNPTVDQYFPSVSVKWTDRAGNDAQVQNETWSSDNPAAATVEPNGDGTYSINTIDDGIANIMVQGDADLGDGVMPVSAVLTVVVNAGAATAAVFAGVEPVAKP